MSEIASGWITALFLHDVAEAIDLSAVAGLIEGTAPVRMASKSSTPSSLQYGNPPVSIDGGAVGLGDRRGSRVRFTLFDYGVVSVALTAPIPDTWEGLLVEGRRWYEDATLAADAERLCRTLVQRLRAAMHDPRAEFLSEDYVVFAVTGVTGEGSARNLLAARGNDLAQLLRGEREPLSDEERDEVLRHHMSYLATDLVVVTWNAAFVYDSDVGARGMLEILEFANSQLLEFRYYDRLLDRELARIYARLQAPGWFSNWLGRRFTRAARQVHALFIDVNELTDKAENALKVAGDVYVARLLTMSAARLGLADWKANVRAKLTTLDAIYRFSVEQTAMARGEMLEAMIVAILVLELVLFFAGIMR